MLITSRMPLNSIINPAVKCISLFQDPQDLLERQHRFLPWDTYLETATGATSPSLRPRVPPQALELHTRSSDSHLRVWLKCNTIWWPQTFPPQPGPPAAARTVSQPPPVPAQS